MDTEVLKATQAVLDAAWDHVHKQGKPGGDIEITKLGNKIFTCKYSHPSGTKCAFAPATEHYSAELESNCASDLLIRYTDHLYPWARECDVDAADAIQRCHDDAADETIGVPSRLIERLERNVNRLLECGVFPMLVHPDRNRS